MIIFAEYSNKETFLMLKLQTPVADSACRAGISYNDKIMMLGSCFADNIGQYLVNYGFDVCVNPFGTLYNPESISRSIDRMISGIPFTEEECIQMGSGSELFCSFSHHTSFARKTMAEFLSNANNALANASEFYHNCNKVIITLGTAWCFRNIASWQIVSNCLKRNAKEFIRERLSADDTASLLQKIISSEAGADKQFIFTVSPIRHLADGAHGNQISKSTLLLAVDNIVESNPETDYFPSYEIMTDELRDYRFYAEDMVHPSSQAVRYIADRFFDWALPSTEQKTLEDNIRHHKQSQHRQMSM